MWAGYSGQALAGVAGPLIEVPVHAATGPRDATLRNCGFESRAVVEELHPAPVEPAVGGGVPGAAKPLAVLVRAVGAGPLVRREVVGGALDVLVRLGGVRAVEPLLMDEAFAAVGEVRRSVV